VSVNCIVEENQSTGEKITIYVWQFTNKPYHINFAVSSSTSHHQKFRNLCLDRLFSPLDSLWNFLSLFFKPSSLWFLM